MSNETFAQNLEEATIRLSHAFALASIPFSMQPEKVAIWVRDRTLLCELQTMIVTDKQFWERGQVDDTVWVRDDAFTFMGWRFVCPRQKWE